MGLIGQSIKHDTYGKGVVTDWKDTTITICFPVGEKKFIYPDAFSQFLHLKDTALQREVQELLDKRKAAKRAERQALQEMQDRKSLLRNLKISPQAQATFDIKADEKEKLFSTWSVSTGCYTNGYSKGEPRIPNRLKPNSMCLLTERSAEQPEKSGGLSARLWWKRISWAAGAGTGSSTRIPYTACGFGLDTSLCFGPISHRSRKNSAGAERRLNI